MSERKRIVLIDAVIWSPEYPASAPLRDVGAWFSRHLTALPGLDLRTVNAEANLTPLLEGGVDGVIVSGSPRDAWTDDAVNLKLCDFVRECGVRGLPVLGVCYGHQILGRALGGIVAPQPQGLELGNTAVRLTPEGEASPLFAGLPKDFSVLSSHADAVLELPAGGRVLVRGDFTRVQSFDAGGRLLGVQFHPEHDPETLRFIWSTRRELWRPKVSFDLDRALEQMYPTPYGGQILRNFVQHIVPPPRA